MWILITLGIGALSAVSGGFKLFAQIFFVFPLMLLFFTCGVWFLWNACTGFEHIDMISFQRSALLGALGALWVTNKY